MANPIQNPLDNLIIGSGTSGNNVKLHRGATGLQFVPDTDSTADGVDAGAASKLSTAGLTLPSDSSFNVSIPSNNNVSIAAGTLHMNDGTEIVLAAVLNVSLLTGISLSGIATGGALGSPAASTVYYLYLDTSAVGLITIDATTGKQVYTSVVGTSFVMLPTAPNAINLGRYVYLASTKTDGSGNYVSGGTYSRSYKVNEKTPVNANPRIYSLPKQAIGSVGSAGQIAGGHFLSTKSWPSTLIQASQVAWFNLASTVNDGGPQGLNLTATGSPGFTGTNIFGTANAALVLNGSTQYVRSTNAFFNPGSVNWGAGGWFTTSAWSTNTGILFSNDNSGASQDGWYVYLSSNQLQLQGATAATTTTNLSFTLPAGFTGFHHIWLSYNAATFTFTLYIDGKSVISMILPSASRGPSSGVFTIGANNSTPSNFLACTVHDFGFANGYALQDQDIRKLYSYRLDHNKGVLAANQLWSSNVYTASSGLAVQDTAWLVDKSDSNSLFADFSDLTSTDSAELFLADAGAGANNLPLMRFDSGDLAALPTFPINHGLGDIPTHIVIAYQVSAGQYEYYSAQGFIQATKAQLLNPNGTLSQFTVNSTNTIRIMAYVGANAAAVSQISPIGLQVKNQLTQSISVPAGVVAFWPGDLDILSFNLDVQGTLVVEGQILNSVAGGTLTGPGTIRNLALPPFATPSQPGILSTGPQQIAGPKSFNSLVDAPRFGSWERNLIINGNFDFWQRGTSQSGATDAAGQADRWKTSIGNNGVNVSTINRSTDVPNTPGYQSQYSHSWDFTGSVVSNGETLVYKFEGIDYQPIHGRKVRLQFWVKAAISGTYGVVFGNNGVNRTLGVSYTINNANTWEKKVLDVQLDTQTSSWAFDNSTALNVCFGLNGTANQGVTSTLNSWTNTSARVITGQVVQPTAGFFRLAQIMLIPQDFTDNPSIDVPFSRAGRTIQQELAMCQRYCYIPDWEQLTSNGIVAWGQAASTTAANFSVPFPVNMRTVPSFTQSGTFTGNTASFGNAGNPTLSITSATSQIGSINGTGMSGLVAGNACDLQKAASNSQLKFEAEL